MNFIPPRRLRGHRKEKSGGNEHGQFTKKKKIEKAVKQVTNNYNRVLLADCYEGYELRQLIQGLEYLLNEANKK